MTRCAYRKFTDSDGADDWFSPAFGSGEQCSNQAEFIRCDPAGMPVCSEHKCRCNVRFVEPQASGVE